MNKEQDDADKDRLQDAAGDPFHHQADGEGLHRILHGGAAALDARAAQGNARPEHREGNRNEEFADEDAGHVGFHVGLGSPELADVRGVGVPKPDFMDEIVRRNASCGIKV